MAATVLAAATTALLWPRLPPADTTALEGGGHCLEEGSLCAEEMRTPGGPIGKGRVDDEAGCAGRVKGPGGCEDRCSVWEAVACEDACRGVEDGPRRCGDRARKSRAEEAARPAQEGPRLCQEARDRTGDQEARGRKSLCRQGGVGLRRALLSSSTSFDLCSRLRRLRLRLITTPATNTRLGCCAAFLGV